MNAPRRPMLPQWKIDLVREAMKFLQEEKGGPVTAKMIARRIPSFSMADIEIAMKLLARGGSAELLAIENPGRLAGGGGSRCRLVSGVSGLTRHRGLRWLAIGKEKAPPKRG